MAQVRSVRADAATATTGVPSSGTAAEGTAGSWVVPWRTGRGRSAIPRRDRRVHVDTAACGVDVGARHWPVISAIPARAQGVADGSRHASQGLPGAQDPDTVHYPSASAPRARLDVFKEEPEEGQSGDEGAGFAAPRDSFASGPRVPVPSPQLSQTEFGMTGTLRLRGGHREVLVRLTIYFPLSQFLVSLNLNPLYPLTRSLRCSTFMSVGSYLLFTT